MRTAAEGHVLIAGRYSLLQEVGRGGMGVVWRGEDQVLGREVALKRVGVIPGGSSPDLARAKREARLAASLNNPHVVAVFDLVTHGDEQWLVMEYVENTTLAQLVRQQGALAPDAAARVLWQAADALAAAHRAGIVHRDVKPSNILVTAEGRVKLSDFGIARASADGTLTQTGMVTGSPAYLSPEVAMGRPATPASDVWALGATLYHALEGRPPYDAGNVMGALYQIVHEAPPRPQHAGWLAPLLERTMTTSPEERWSMAEVRDFLAHGSPIAAPLLGGRPSEPASDATTVMPPLPSEEPTTMRVPAAEPPPERLHRPTAAPAPGSTPTPDQAASDRGRSRGWVVPVLTGLLVGALALVVAGWIWLGGSDDGGRPDRGTTAGNTESVEPSETSAEPSPTEPTPDAAEMRAFAADYLATVTSDPAAAWDRLTPAFQRQSGGFGGYRSFWGTIESAAVNEVTADPAAKTVSYSVTYTRTDGTQLDDEVTLELTMRGDDYLIAGER